MIARADRLLERIAITILVGLVVITQATCDVSDLTSSGVDLRSIRFDVGIAVPEGCDITRDSVSVAVSYRTQLCVEVSGSNGGPSSVIWSTGDSSMAWVDQSGLVMGINVGSVPIHARLIAPDLDTGVVRDLEMRVFVPELFFRVKPNNVKVGEPFLNAVQVWVVGDTAASDSTLIRDAGDPVTILGGFGGSGGLDSLMTELARGGIASFPDLRIGEIGSGYKLEAMLERVTASGDTLMLESGPSNEFDVVPGDSTTIAARLASITTGGADTIVVTARDANGRALSGAKVEFSVKPDAGTSFSPDSATTDADGVAETIFRSTVAGTKAITAMLNKLPVADTAFVTVSAGPVVQDSSVIRVDADTIAACGGLATITVFARDDFGNPVSGAEVVLASTGSGNALTQPTQATDVEGIATGTLSSTIAEDKTISATIDASAVSTNATVTVVSGVASRDSSSVAASPATITAGAGSSTVTVTARDGCGNPVSGAAVVLSATGAGNLLIQPSVPTGANGIATGFLSSSVAEQKTITVSIDFMAVSETAVVEVEPGSISGATSTITASPAAIEAGNESSTMTVTAQDEFGNPISGSTVVLSSTGAGNALSQPAGTTDADGMATGTLSSVVAGGKTVSATIDGIDVNETVVVLVNPGPISFDSSFIVATPTSLEAGVGTSTITVTALDEFRNPISAETVLLDATGSGNTLTQPASPTNAAGQATGSLSSTTAETKSISAGIEGTLLVETVDVTVTPGPISADSSTISASSTSIEAGTELSVITVVAVDAFENPIAGATVDFSATGSGNTIAPPSETTDIDGEATTNFSSTVAEDKTLSATIDGTPAAQTVDITVTPGPADTSSSTIVADPDTIAREIETSDITVTVFDEFNNPIANMTMAFTSSGIGDTFNPAIVTTGEDGIASTEYSSLVAELKIITVVSGGFFLMVDVLVTP